MIKREEVEALLAACERDRIAPHPSNEVLAELARTWLAVDGAPKMTVCRSMWLNAPTAYEGQRVKLVLVPEAGGGEG